MTIVFTICSNNYLAQAKTLGDSLKKNNPDVIFQIGLMDRIDKQIDYTFLAEYELVEVETIGIDGFDDMQRIYNIVELNTSVKPFYFQYFFSKFTDLEHVIYFDPDILIVNSISPIISELNQSAVILTPHINNPAASKNIQWEVNSLKYGLYNFGFIGLSKCDESIKLINWWQQRTKEYCFDDPHNGYFTDQLWGSLVPLFFNSVSISKNYGLNVAYWNLHERIIEKTDNIYYVNKKELLIFFHFSSFDPLVPSEIAKGQEFDPLDKNTALGSLYQLYSDLLIENNYKMMSKYVCFFLSKNKMSKEKRLNKSLYYRFYHKAIRKLFS